VAGELAEWPFWRSRVADFDDPPTPLTEGQMSTESRLRTVQAQPSAEDKAERRRMSFYDLFFLAAGGVLGSGWLVHTVTKTQGTWYLAVFPWLIGGALMLVLTAVMVELSTVVPKTGGLIFLPLQSSGPFLATVVAAGVWVFYAVNPASEAVAMVRGLAAWSHQAGLVNVNSHGKENGLTGWGIGWAAVLLGLIVAANLLGPRLFLMINNVLTAFKILVPLLIVALLIYALVHSSGPAPVRHSTSGTGTIGSDLGPVFSAVTSGSVIYAYLGFQGPLDFAGNVRRRGVGEAARLRWAVYGTVCGSILLYVSLQLVIVYMLQRNGKLINGTQQSLFAAFVTSVAPSWAVTPVTWLLSLDAVLAPAGTGMIFTYVLTREVAALSRAHLTHRGLQQSRYSVIPLASGLLRKLFGDDRLDVYWLILIVDLFASEIALLCFGGNWKVLGNITSILALVVYSTQSVVFASLRRLEPRRFPRLRYAILAEVGFVLIGVTFCLVDSTVLWQGMAALTVGCLLLLGLPLVLPASRWYDATAHAAWFRQLRTKNPSVRSAALLLGYFAVLALASLVHNHVWHGPTSKALDMAGLAALAVIAVLAWLTFRRLVTLSERYMAQHPPTLPTPLSPPGRAGRRSARGTATGRSG
jgi:amino acid transporter